MTYHEIIENISSLTRGSPMEKSADAARAVLETLSERLAGGEPGDLASQLPEELAGYLKDGNYGGESFPLVEFYERVARRMDVDHAGAVLFTHAVFYTLEDAVSEGEIEDVKAQLPAEFEKVFHNKDN